MEINPINEVRLYKSVPFLIDYANIVQFDNLASQESYFESLTHKDYTDLTYTRNNGQIIVDGNKESLLDYNYMSFTNKNYGTKTFYAFITRVVYENPNATRIYFTIDEWQTWCFDITFMPTFIERKHCQRWNSDGTPVINTVPEDLEYGSEYITKDHQQYNNNLYWIAFVSSDESSASVYGANDVPSLFNVYYLPIYKTTSTWYSVSNFNNSAYVTNPMSVLNIYRSSTEYVNMLVSCFIIEDPPFDFTYTLEYSESLGDYLIKIQSNDLVDITLTAESLGSSAHVLISQRHAVPTRTDRTYPKYGNLTNGITESKLLMYPYSYVQLLDGQGDNFIIKPEYLNDSNITVRTYTTGGLSCKLAHIVRNYRYSGITLGDCRWELQNGIINSSANNLTIIDGYEAAYLQGHSNTILQQITAVKQQATLSNNNAWNSYQASLQASSIQNLANMFGSGLSGGLGGALGGASGLTSLAQGLANAAGTGIMGLGSTGATAITGKAAYENTEAQGELNKQQAIASANAKKQDAEQVADNVSLQAGDVYFTFQNQFNGYCLIYRQISDEYVNILQDYFQKYGYKVNRVETPNLHTRESWDYIRTIGCNLKGSINNDSLQIIKDIFNNGTTVWHTTDVGNYNLSNNEI